MIRDFQDADIAAAIDIHAASGLPGNCFPNLTIVTPEGETKSNPLFVVKSVYEHEGKPVLMSFQKLTSELYLLVDHQIGTPEERWEWMKELKDHMKQEAWKLGIEQLTAWIPTELEASFEKRLLDMGFVRSPWQSYTLNVED